MGLKERKHKRKRRRLLKREGVKGEREEKVFKKRRSKGRERGEDREERVDSSKLMKDRREDRKERVDERERRNVYFQT